MTQNLLPCPFCGGQATHSPPTPAMKGGYVHGGSVGCAALVGCCAPRFIYDPEDGPERVIAAWNKRPA